MSQLQSLAADYREMNLTVENIEKVLEKIDSLDSNQIVDLIDGVDQSTTAKELASLTGLAQDIVDSAHDELLQIIKGMSDRLYSVI